jgi:hypothetical protein
MRRDVHVSGKFFTNSSGHPVFYTNLVRCWGLHL